MAVAVYEQPFSRDVGLAGAAMSYRGHFREFHDHFGPDGAPAALFGFPKSADCAGMTEAQVRSAFGGQLRHLFGPQGADPLDVAGSDWADGRLHWASTETAPVSAGHIEGAIRAALRIADRVTATLAHEPTAR